MSDGGFDPARPDGVNISLQSAIAADGRPVIGTDYTVPARAGVAALLDTGDRLVVVNPNGAQVCDFWAFNPNDLNEHLSMPHLHTALSHVTPRPGDALVTNRRRALLIFDADSSPGVHDTVIAACDLDRYRELGCVEYHDNCTDNLRMALMAIGLAAPAIPAPFNLWMNTPVAADGSIDWRAPVAAPGDHVTFRALAPALAVMSACPQDMTPVNGVDQAPGPLRFRVER